MIKNVKFFVNNNEESIKASKEIKEKFLENGFNITDENADLAIAIGGDGAFLRMVKNNNFDSDICYVGINTGTLGFLQEIKKEEVDNFIEELKYEGYKIEELGIQETVIEHEGETSRFYSLNEISIRDRNLGVSKLDISIDGDLLEKFTGDGVLIASSCGSTAYNLSLGGSIVYDTFTSLQITPIAAINSKVYRSLLNSVIIPDKKVISIVPRDNKDSLIVNVDGENNFYDKVEKIETKIDTKRIKCLRLSHYNFPQKINNKFLMD